MAQPHEVRSLTGLRGLAAIYVMAGHTILGDNGSSPISRFHLHGYLAVDLFFGLSGFVMALSYGESFRSDHSAANYLRFLGRRVARIYPLYIVATVFAFLGNLSISAPVIKPWEIAWNILMLQSWGLAQSIDGPAWSISAECAAYILFPLILLAALFRGWKSASLAATVCAAGVILLVLLVAPAITYPHPNDALNIFAYDYGLSVFRCLFEFTLGVIAYRVSLTAVGRRAATSNAFAFTVAAAILILLTMRHVDILTVLLFPFLLIALSGDSVLPARILESKPIHLLGLLSYSIYLVHGVVYDLRKRFIAHDVKLGIHPSSGLLLVGSILIVLLVSWTSHRLIEVPGRKFLQRIFEPSGHPPPPSAVL